MPMLVVKYYKNALTTSRKTREKPPSASDFQLQYRQKLIVNHGKGRLKGKIEQEFDSLFTKTTGYIELDKRIASTFKNRKELLTVLESPEVPLHNNGSEIAVREGVLKRRSAMEQDPI